LTGSLHPEQLASLVAVDALLRRQAARGEPLASWELSTLVGDVAMQRAVERVMARSGDQRSEVGREDFDARARAVAAEAESDLRGVLGALRVQAEIGGWGADSDRAVRAARVAFVRLYEAGLLARTDAVLDSCPSCDTVVDAADADEVELVVDLLRIRVPTSGEPLEVELDQPELLVGAVALAVPEHLGIADEYLVLPLVDDAVPVVTVEGIDEPRLVVPGHDRWSHGLARQLGYPLVEVLDAEGVVCRPGPLEGLGRYAARQSATALLAEDGHVVGHSEGVRQVTRCYRCHTVLVPLLGRHWLLSYGELVEPVVEAIEAGAVRFVPPVGLDELVSSGRRSGAWCVSQQLWSGQPIPVFTCLDCGQTKVTVEDRASCGSCMGTLEQDPDVLDARFVAAVAPLVMLGWPGAALNEVAADVALVVGPVGLETWALPMAALGLRLAGRIPFDEVVVQRPTETGTDAGAMAASEVLRRVEEMGPRAARAALLLGEFGTAATSDVVGTVDHPPSGDADLESWVEPYDHALAVYDARSALGMLLDVLREGVPISAASRVHALARPLLSE